MEPQNRIRWLETRHYEAVLAIDRQAFDPPWTAAELKAFVEDDRNTMGLVYIEQDKSVSGFLVYRIHKTKFDIIRLAVEHEQRRRGVGRSLMQKMIRKLSPNMRNRIVCDVAETNLIGCEFLSACGLHAVNVIRNGCVDEDLYRFCYRVSPQEKKAS